MSVLVLSPPYKPTRHNTRLNPRWGYIRQHALAAFPIWERGGTRIYNASRPSRYASIAFGTGGDWQNQRYGPLLHFTGTGNPVADLGTGRIGSVGLFAASTERWTACVRCRVVNNSNSTPLARSNATAVLTARTFQIRFNRPGGVNITPTFVIRGTSTTTGWQLDDGDYHTIWVVWDGSTATAYYDAAQGTTVLGVGTATEESENITFGARGVGAAEALNGDLDFVAILDVPLRPGTIARWNRDLYAPWRPYRPPVARFIEPIIPGLETPIVYAPRKALTLDHLELWTDVEANGGGRIGPIAQYLSLEESASLNGEHTLTLSVALSHPIRRLIETAVDDVNLRIDQVIRRVMTDGSWSEHRISETTKRNQGGSRTLEITARSIFQDLGFRGIVARTTADGRANTDFQALALPMETHLREYILPALQNAGQPFWGVGTLEHGDPVDMVYQGYTPLAALRELASAAGGLELQVTGTSAGYLIHLVKQIGVGLPPTYVRARQNLTDLGFTESSADQATRVYAFGAPFQDKKPSVGLATWEVAQVTVVGGGVYDIRLQDPAGGPGPIQYDNQFLPPPLPFDDPNTDTPEVRPTPHLQYLTGFEFTAQITETFSATQVVRVQAGIAPPTGTGHRVRFLAGPPNDENLFVDHPGMVTKYGVRVATLDRPDIPATDNWIPNPLARIWPETSPLPTGWDIVDRNGFPTDEANQVIVSRETDSRFWEHGGQAVRAAFNNSGASFGLSLPIATIPFKAQGYLSFFVKLTTISGSVQVWVQLRRPATAAGFPLRDGPAWVYSIPFSTGPTGVENDILLPLITNIAVNIPEEIGVAAAWDLTKYPLFGGTVQLIVSASDLLTPPGGAGTLPWAECIIEAGQLTNSSEQMPLMEGNGATKLHQAANERLGLYSTPAPVVSVNLIDLALADGLSVPSRQLQLGAPIIISDPESEVSVSTRMIDYKVDWKNRLKPSLGLSNERRDILSLLATKPRAVRHQTKVVPRPTRGVTYPS